MLGMLFLDNKTPTSISEKYQKGITTVSFGSSISLSLTWLFAGIYGGRAMKLDRKYLHGNGGNYGDVPYLLRFSSGQLVGRIYKAFWATVRYQLRGWNGKLGEAKER